MVSGTGVVQISKPAGRKLGSAALLGVSQQRSASLQAKLRRASSPRENEPLVSVAVIQHGLNLFLRKDAHLVAERIAYIREYVSDFHRG
ncbi:hypothetical protein SAMN05421747_12054 [Parapedobacter composti]|uniref:Uncharacterized protein n=1 Tax=Parapedobacter composti TaxID=623281 RepID=A0A1I1LCL7_9SPHI|nr:hypothetical protein SAMN05421747_12054 [Parapedobacter composti]